MTTGHIPFREGEAVDRSVTHRRAFYHRVAVWSLTVLYVEPARSTPVQYRRFGKKKHDNQSESKHIPWYPYCCVNWHSVEINTHHTMAAALRARSLGTVGTGDVSGVYGVPRG